MKKFAATGRMVLLGLGMMLVSCIGTAPTDVVGQVDSLNQVAYVLRYKDMDSSRKAASEACQRAGMYGSGRAEAYNNLGFCAFMCMDFEEARRCYAEVYGLTKNELELLIADIGLMKICQRTASNKEFYDYRNRALGRMKRIDEDSHLFVERHEQARLNYAKSEFYIVSALYHSSLQQHGEASACMEQLPADEVLAADTAQWLYGHYVRGGALSYEGVASGEQRSKEFDHLYLTWLVASRQGYVCFEGNGLLGLSNLMASGRDYEFFLSRRSHALSQLGMPVDTLLPLRLGQKALQLFRQYGDLYQMAGSYVAVGKYLNMHGRYQEALDTLQRALVCVDNPDKMPECTSRIHEQLSVAYAGLGMKAESDMNRNIYLDILDDTRQDKELESRYMALESASDRLNVLIGVLLAGLLGAWLACWFLNRRSKARHIMHLKRLRLMLDICQKITASIPADVQSEEEVVNAIRAAVGGELKELFGQKEVDVEAEGLRFSCELDKEELAMVKVINPYVRWALDNGMTSILLGDEQKRIEKQHYIHEQHIAGNKRQNLVKKACLAIVNDIHPYIDRIVNEVRKLTASKGGVSDVQVRAERFQYMDELVTKINEYNDILALWIKVRQGSLSLNIETFGLNELFELLRKGSRAFEMKRQHLEVVPTDACVRADKALTLFMINTLAENARKYTPEGGTVKVYARQLEGCVEISVEDNGIGLSARDVSRIVGEKVYDSRQIGMENASDHETLQRSKGSGFGLMNCKGIIEKYRKTNELFRVCLFSVESRLGQGSRFYFRLPVGVRKPLLLLAMFFSCAFFSCGRPSAEAALCPKTSVGLSDSLRCDAYEALLDSASDYANMAYYCNVDGFFQEALLYIDSAMLCLNAHYARYAPQPHRYMTMLGDEEPAELEWWYEPFNSDFHVILDIRNEAAVSFMALKRWEEYTYNNWAYTVLYKLLGEDKSLEEYCRQLERSTTNRSVGILLGLLLLVAGGTAYYLLYLRKRLLYRWNLEQVLEINRLVFTASVVSVSEEELPLHEEERLLHEIPQRMVDEAFDAVNELAGIESLGIAVWHEATGRLEYAFHSEEAVVQESCRQLMEQCFSRRSFLSDSSCQAFPLLIEAGGEQCCIGVLGLVRREGGGQSADYLLLELMTRYVAIVVFNAVVKLSDKYHDIEEAQDEARRASWEEGVLHVQNMVLDNCLSAIKHETIYYPHRMKQLIGRLRQGGVGREEERTTIEAIAELVEYYKGIFTLLSRCASRQLEDVTFRRAAVPVSVLTEAATKYFRKASRNSSVSVEWEAKPLPDTAVIGDFDLLCFLLENLIDEALSVSLSGRICLEAVVDESYVCFRFTDLRRQKTQQELNRLFYPRLAGMTVGIHGELRGIEYLLCKQIIREHDEYSGRRGCRINAETVGEHGFTVYFTLLRAVNR